MSWPPRQPGAEMRLAALLVTAGLDGQSAVSWPESGTDDPEIAGVSHDSRSVASGDLFCCVAGGTHDGHRFAADAVAAGAAGLLVERPVTDASVPVVRVSSVRQAMGPLAAAFHGWPSRSLDLVGVTGTNGKTSVVHLLRSILKASGRRAQSWGTLSGERTTPEGIELQALIASWVAGGVDAAALEVSSHALAQHRVDGTMFAAVAFTTLGRDHLDFHNSIEDYEAAKARLFDGTFAAHAVISTADEAGRRMATRAETAGMSVVAVDPNSADSTVSATGCSVLWRGRTLGVNTGGRFTVANALVAAELAVVLGCSEDDVVAGLATATPVPGRFQPISLAGGPVVIVDYAHTPDALKAALIAARDALNASTGGSDRSPGRLIVVFGCGGERDVGKRSLMGRVADESADVVVVTSDNPRGEPPEGVIADILAGMERLDPVVEPDRRRGIAAALSTAAPDDLVVVAGRGHETSQEVAGRLVPFDDRTVIIEEWERLGPSIAGAERRIQDPTRRSAR